MTPLAKYKNRLVLVKDIDTQPHICFLPDKHWYWVQPLEECLNDHRINYEFQTSDGFIVKVSELKEIFTQIRSLKRLTQCQVDP